MEKAIGVDCEHHDPNRLRRTRVNGRILLPRTENSYPEPNSYIVLL
jgi:hypothetical protein